MQKPRLIRPMFEQHPVLVIRYNVFRSETSTILIRTIGTHIKSKAEVSCLTKVNANTVENKLISIAIPDAKQKEIYVSKDIATDFSVVNDKIHIGEISLLNKQNYVIIDGTKVEVPSVVSFIYELGGEPYYATLKGALGEEEMYYLIKDNLSIKQTGNKVYLRLAG